MILFKKISLLVVPATFACLGVAFASGQQTPIPQDNTTDTSKAPPAKQKPSTEEKGGREVARVVGQVENAGKKIGKGWKGQRKKDKKNQHKSNP